MGKVAASIDVDANIVAFEGGPGYATNLYSVGGAYPPTKDAGVRFVYQNLKQSILREAHLLLPNSNFHIDSRN